MRSEISRLKSAELISAAGAGFLGAGLALMWPQRLLPFAVPILVSGLVAHALGMYLKHRWERASTPGAAWITAMYWGCWAGLAGLIIYVILR